MADYVEGKDKNQILKELVGTGEPGSPVHEQQKMAIIVRSTEDLEKAIGGLRTSIGTLEQSMSTNAKSSDKLSHRVFWLNVVLTVATVLATLIAGYSAFVSGH